LTVAGVLVTTSLARRIWRDRKQASRASKLLASVIVVSAIFGVGTLVGLVKALSAVGGESIEPAQKARILGEGIAETMNSLAFALLVWVPSVVAVLVIARRRKR
jgi:biopolymer transport protein ExbB/TolQ